LPGASLDRDLMRQSFLHRNRLALAAISLGYGVVQLDVTIVNVAIDSIGHSFGGGVSALQSVVLSQRFREDRRRSLRSAVAEKDRQNDQNS
jgi:hypothetical protein